MSLDRRQIRAFLSSTFSDFQQERDLLAKQVFPALRQKAKDRGVDVVDVDLRWGITEEQSQQGQTLPICLAEIDNCRPYFIGLLGERYGWVPDADHFSPELLERQAWLREHQGGTSVTELEILHGVLNNPAMAGRAFFYFRDPGYSTARVEAGEPGWRSEDAQDRQKLEALKRRICASGFPVVEGLASPQAIAERIEADLWALIEEQFPEGEQPDALVIEDARHASYRADRTGLYLGGSDSIDELEQWIGAGEQRVLITGDSGSGKSALIANWMVAHDQSHPEDVVFAHHLGCSSDANAVRPLLARLIDSANRLLAEERAEPLAVPQDWWELVAKVGETLATLSAWCRRNGRRWIWVLDGLDKLSADDQQALPWLPTTLPPGIQVVASALASPARSILEGREYRSLAIGPLQRPEQEALIDRYLRIFARQLEAGLKERLLAHPLAGSPLFLRVLLEELRLCGRFETLGQQMEHYLGAESIDDLYERVLERLESDGHGAAVRHALTALWASRAGLTESELLAITGLLPAAWAPIGIGLQEALGESNGRLVFGHDYLRIAVQDRYLPTEEERRQAHSDLADWFEGREGWDERTSEELPWQLQEARRLEDLRDLLLTVPRLAELVADRGSREVLSYWRAARDPQAGELDELITAGVEQEIDKLREDPAELMWFADQLADLIDTAGLYRQLLLRFRELSLELFDGSEGESEKARLIGLALLASTNRDMGRYRASESLYGPVLKDCELQLGLEHPDTLSIVNNLALLFQENGDYGQAEALYKRALEAKERLLGSEHPDTLATVNNLALLYQDNGDYGQAEALTKRALEARERLLGPEHPDTLTSVNNLALLLQENGDYGQAEALYKRALEARERLLGPEHPDTLTSVNNLALLYRDQGDFGQAEALSKRALEASERLLGPEHPHTLVSVNNLALLYRDNGDYGQAEALSTRALEARERLLGPEHPGTLTSVNNLALLLQENGDYGQAEALYKRALQAKERLMGPEHPSTLTTVANLAGLYLRLSNYPQAEALYQRALEAFERHLGPSHHFVIKTAGNLALLYQDKGDYGQAESLYQQALRAIGELLGPECPEALTIVNNLAGLYQDKGDYEQAKALYRRALEVSERQLGSDHPDTNNTRYHLACTLHALGCHDEAIVLRRIELSWSRKKRGNLEAETLISIDQLAKVLCESRAFDDAEALFRELVVSRQQVLKPGDAEIGRALANLAKALNIAGKLEEALGYTQQVLDHWVRFEGCDSWITNSARLDLARVLYKLQRNAEALKVLDAIQASLSAKPDQDDDVRELLADAAELRQEIEGQP